MGLLSKLENFDAYPKLASQFRVRTFSGAVLSIAALLFIAYLFFSELGAYMSTTTVDHLYVDTNRNEKLRINFDVEFPRIPCVLLSVDAMDVSGSHDLGVEHHVTKVSLAADGSKLSKALKSQLGGTMYPKGVSTVPTQEESEREAKRAETIKRIKEPDYCGSCYGAERKEGDCCKTCTDVRQRYQDKGWAMPDLAIVEQCIDSGETQADIKRALAELQGCRIAGYLEVNKVAGNFHFAPGRSFQHAHAHIHDLAAFEEGVLNSSHIIHHLQFGEDYPGIVNPLDDTRKILKHPVGGMFRYYTKIVPTEYERSSGDVVKTNQYSVTEQFRKVRMPNQKDGHGGGGHGHSHGGGGGGLPGVFVFYEISPIMVHFSEVGQGFAHFLTQLCAIIGGVFTVAGLLDRVVYHGLKSMEAKSEIGKMG